MTRVATVAAVAALLAGAAAGAVTAATPRTPAAIVRAWSKALNAGDDRGAGALFARNALAIQGGLVLRLGTPRIAAVWNSGLPCAGTIVRLRVTGNVVTATFRLGHRKGHACDGPGELAAARFTIAHGKIVRWEQVAPEPATPIA